MTIDKSSSDSASAAADSASARTESPDADAERASAAGEPANAYAEAKARVRGGADPDIEARRLVGQMTTGEKLGCLDGDTDFWPGIIDMAGGGYYLHPFPAAEVARLGFPGLVFTDGPRGIVVGRSTCFPVTMARGATFDVELEERVGEAIGIEARIHGATFYGGVCVNLLRHPRWGRAQETYGEDPCHLGEMGAALVRGVQRHAMACVKHFACNSIENARFKVNVIADADVLDDVYLAHFRRIVGEGVASVMTAYNALNGQWCGDSPALIAATLRERWKFAGFVVSDFIYGLRDPIGSVGAGLDIEMPFRQQRVRALPAALADGRLRIEDVDAAAIRIVRTVLRFDAATPDAAPDPALLAGDAHRALARRVAAEAIVLLRNESVDAEPVLPLRAASLRRIAVFGRLADVANLGDGGSSNVHPPSVVTPLAGLRAALPHVEWTGDAAGADVADLAIVVVGFTCDDEGEFTGGFSSELAALMPPPPDESAWTKLGEAGQQKLAMAPGGDRDSLRLRSEDEELILRIAALQPRTIVLVMGGSAVLVEPWIENVAAALQVWYPGMEGGHAIADVLTGAVNPCGRLPFAVPTDESHLPHFDPDASEIRYDGWHGQWLLDRDGHAARFPFGFGLSYSRFSIESAAVESGGRQSHAPPEIVVQVANTGSTSGSTVVFFFRIDGLSRRRLFAFRKVRLDAGARSTVRAPAGDPGRIVVAQHAGDAHAIELEVPE
ncbi:MAG TPA: glycoside hydrolase family 3 C-terminal domain-containing protein [Candidatus Limnocylindrales bacterium]|nr:glycoside hydrolase family 3 C-terminal domain-containing protein [Candidatus Limnocylindrales bacterium]